MHASTRPESSSNEVAPDGDGYWPSALRLWSAQRPQELWRRHSDAVNRALVARWLHTTGAVLKTDLWDEAVGDGLYSALSASASEIVGIDSSAEVVSRARQRHPQLVGLEADVRRLPFPDGRFDAVVSNSTLDHFESVDDIALALRELRRVLRPGGELVLTLDNPINPIVALTKALPRRTLHRFWLRHDRVSGRLGLLPYFVGATVGPRRLARLLRDEGFEVRERGAVVHVPRVAAVIAGTALERHAGARTHSRYLRLLGSFERFSTWPTRYLTGHFVAVHAVRRDVPHTPASTTRPGAQTWTPARVVRRAREVLREEGLRTVWFRALGETVYRRLALVELDLGNLTPVVDAEIPLEFRFLTAADTDRYTELRPETTSDEVRARLDRGDRCFVACHEGRIVSARWIATGKPWIEYLDRALALREDEVYLFETFTHPDYRGRSVSSAAGTRLAHELASKGFERIVAGTSPDSHAVARTAEKAGYRRVGTIGYIRLGPLRRHFLRKRSRAGSLTDSSR